MSSELLTWVASGLIALVLASTLWIAHAIQPERAEPALLLADVAAAVAPAASTASAKATR